MGGVTSEAARAVQSQVELAVRAKAIASTPGKVRRLAYSPTQVKRGWRTPSMTTSSSNIAAGRTQSPRSP